MNLGTLILFTVLTSGQPGDAASEADRAQIRCRPAPYYVSDRGVRPKAQRTFMTGSRVPIRTGERRARPCHLMHAPTPAHGAPFIRIADED